MRLTNDQFISNVHRVFNRAEVDRLSMPFFFGFNFNETVSVLPSCVDEEHPAKYEPISCGEVSPSDPSEFSTLCLVANPSQQWCKKRLAIVKVLKGE